MRVNAPAWLALAGLFVVLAWLYRGPLGLTAALSPATFAPPSGPGASGAARKCVRQGEVLYTQGACPAGSREQPVGGGTLTVLPAHLPVTAASAPAGPPNARDLLLKPDAVDIKQQRMEAIIGK